MHASAIAASRRLKSWRENPLLFAWENFRFEPDEWQKDFLQALGGGYNPVRRVAAKACTGPGKTAVLAIAGWHRLSCFGRKNEHPKGAALSITKDNLKDNLWPELSAWQKRSEFLTSQFTWGAERIKSNDHPEDWFLAARSVARDADEEAIGSALSGLHCAFPFILLDETGDMHPTIGKKANQIFTGSPVDALIAAAGNPTSVSGLLYEIFTHLRDQWIVFTITADPDDPKRTPRVSIEHARAEINAHGRDNPWIMATILGQFPPAGFNSLLGVEEVEKAMKRFYRPDVYEKAAKILGVDVAREGDDRSIVFPRQGVQAFRPKTYRNLRSHELAGHVGLAEDKWKSDGNIIDITGGWGAGVLDALGNMGRVAYGCQFAGRPFDPRYANKRAEIWFLMAEWVKNGGALPYIPELVAELTTPTYTFHGDKFLVEPKDQVKKRLGRSPDLADGLALTFAFPIFPKSRVGGRTPGAVGEWDPMTKIRAEYSSANSRGDYDPFKGV